MVDTISILRSIIELAEARNIEAEILERQPVGTPDIVRKELQIYLSELGQTTLRYITAIMYVGMYNRISKDGFGQFYDHLERTTKYALIHILMSEKLLPIYLKAGMKVLEQKNSSTP